MSDVLSLLAELLLNPNGIVEEVRDWRRERRDRQRARATRIPCALRVVDGTLPALGRRWTRGIARVPPGAIVFEPDSPWRQRMTMSIRSASLEPSGEIPRRRPRGMDIQPRRIVLKIAQATLEWLVPEEQLQQSMGVTRRSVRDGRMPAG